MAWYSVGKVQLRDALLRKCSVAYGEVLAKFSYEVFCRGTVVISSVMVEQGVATNS